MVKITVEVSQEDFDRLEELRNDHVYGDNPEFFYGRMLVLGGEEYRKGNDRNSSS